MARMRRARWGYLMGVPIMILACGQKTQETGSTDCSPAQVDSPGQGLRSNDGWVYGVTIDDPYYQSKSDPSATRDAIINLGKHGSQGGIAARVVFDEDQSASEYDEALDYYTHSAYLSGKPRVRILGELLDSASLGSVSVADYRQRASDYFNRHQSKVAVWEICNECNGEWTRCNASNQVVGTLPQVYQKVKAAYDVVKTGGGKTALTLYLNDWCMDGTDCPILDTRVVPPEHAMLTWARNLPDEDVKAGLDYVFVSYYREHCAYHDVTDAEWQNIFDQLGQIFPNALLGIGEAGYELEDKDAGDQGVQNTAARRAHITRTYTTTKVKHPRWIGGGFWWYFVEEATIDTEPNNQLGTPSLWPDINSAMNSGWTSDDGCSKNVTGNVKNGKIRSVDGFGT